MSLIFKAANRSLSYVKLRGADVLRDPRINKGPSFSLVERQLLGVHGLLPPGVNTIDEQLARVNLNLGGISDDISKHLFLAALHDTNEELFFKLVTERPEYCLPIISTPTVEQVCQKHGLLFDRASGLYISIHDKKHIKKILDNWPEPNIRVLVVSDGEMTTTEIDLGASGMAKVVAKLTLYTALAGINPTVTLPVVLDVGTDNQDLLDDPFYLGLRQKRVRGRDYHSFVDSFVTAVIEKYGSETLIEFGDLGLENAANILEKYGSQYSTFNGDIQGTASAVLSAVLGHCKAAERKLTENTFLVRGPGPIAAATSRLLMAALVRGGDSEVEASSKVFIFERRGLLAESGVLKGPKITKGLFSKNVEEVVQWDDAVAKVKPTVLIGDDGPQVFSPTIVRMVEGFIERPMFLCLSKEGTSRRASGQEGHDSTTVKPYQSSNLERATHDGPLLSPNRPNDWCILPGLVLAIDLFRIRPVTEDLFIVAAEASANQKLEGFQSSEGTKDVALEVAVKVAECAYLNGIAHHRPRPKDIRHYIKGRLFHPQFRPSISLLYDHPK